MVANKVYIYDTTLRDGQQTTGVDFSVSDKLAISRALDKLGIDYIEGGWPGASPTDTDYFNNPPKLKISKLSAFGMTRRTGTSSANDPGLNSLINSSASSICIVGKTSAYHVEVALKIDKEENLKMISESIKQIVSNNKEAIFDAEHFFDGYKLNNNFAMDCIKAAFDAGARWIVLCDTNGGTLPNEVSTIVNDVVKVIPGKSLGIHAHNDTENAVANSLAALNAGVRQVQGTINGLGERCGNTNLISLIPTLVLKTDFETNIDKENLKHLKATSNLLDERLNRSSNNQSPYVGNFAFSHKGGLHASAIKKDPTTYEHINPDTVGNKRNIVISDQAGRSNVEFQLEDLGIEADKKTIEKLVNLVKEKQFEGYSYDGALASFEILVRRELKQVSDFYILNRFRVTDERRWNAKGKLITESEATINITVNNEEKMTVATGNGPVNAIDSALRKGLVSFYPTIDNLKLTDYKVRIVSSEKGTGAITRVTIESSDGKNNFWSTIGVSTNIIDASYNAIHDSITYKLYHDLNGKN
tara:strand:+ start:12431 stop:14020 length:1590 start_codon:yes stop_codon:yes gene_type:complete